MRINGVRFDMLVILHLFFERILYSTAYKSSKKSINGIKKIERESWNRNYNWIDDTYEMNINGMYARPTRISRGSIRLYLYSTDKWNQQSINRFFAAKVKNRSENSKRLYRRSGRIYNLAKKERKADIQRPNSIVWKKGTWSQLQKILYEKREIIDVKSANKLFVRHNFILIWRRRKGGRFRSGAINTVPLEICGSNKPMARF